MVSWPPQPGGGAGLGGKKAMISTRWLAKRKPYWARLEELVDRAGRRGISVFDHLELQELGLLYRQTASDLAVVREDATSRQLAAYLNHLLGRAHNLNVQILVDENGRQPPGPPLEGQYAALPQAAE